MALAWPCLVNAAAEVIHGIAHQDAKVALRAISDQLGRFAAGYPESVHASLPEIVLMLRVAVAWWACTAFSCCDRSSFPDKTR